MTPHENKVAKDNGNGSAKNMISVKSDDPQWRRQLADEMADEEFHDLIKRGRDPEKAAADADRLRRIMSKPFKITEGIF